MPAEDATSSSPDSSVARGPARQERPSDQGKGSNEPGGVASSSLGALPNEVTSHIVGAVDWLKARATLRLTTLLTLLVYGSVALAGLLAAVVFLVVGTVRIWDVYVPVHPEGRRVWLAYLVLGGALFSAGVWLWSRAPGKGER
jgi:hypothetical protein